MKRALVTGGGTRIGAALALALGEDGYDVGVHCYRTKVGAAEIAQKITKLGRRATVIEADLADPGAAKKIASTIKTEFGGLELLVNSASFWPSPETLSAEFDLLGETLENWEHTMAVNVRAPFFLMQQCAPMLSENKLGQIINILDQSISKPYQDRAAHTGSKSALAALTKLAAKELMGKVRVNGLEFGAILPPPGISPSEEKKLRWGGTAAAVKGMRFLIENDFVSGEIIPIRGEWHLGVKD